MYQEADALVNQFTDAKINFEEIDENISNLITWHDNSKGKIAKFPKIKESHKDILFTDWEIQIKRVEREVSSASETSNNMIETINYDLWYACFIKKCSPINLLEIEDLQISWHEILVAKEQRIRQLLHLNWEAYWSYLVKPLRQLMAL